MSCWFYFRSQYRYAPYSGKAFYIFCCPHYIQKSITDVYNKGLSNRMYWFSGQLVKNFQRLLFRVHQVMQRDLIKELVN